MQGYHRGFVRLLYAIILAQFIAIAVLLGGFSNEYLTNTFFRSWIDNNYPWLGLLLQGQVDAFLVGIAIGATIILIQNARNQESIRSESQVRPTPFASNNESANHAARPTSTSPSLEKPEDILVELEKED